MDKKIQRILNIIMSCFVGVFIGSGLYRYWHFQKYPELYFIQSAPWYTSIIVQGLLTLILLAICMIIKVIFMEKIEMMKKIALILGIVFLTLTLIGGFYVIDNHGEVNAGYAVVPGLWTMICFGYCKNKKQD